MERTSLKSYIHNVKQLLALQKERLMSYPRERAKFLERHGYPLNLKSPQSFNEKLIWKKIHDRNPLLPIVADKYRVREYIRSRLGDKTAEAVLIPLYHVSKDPRDIPFDSLPASYVAKANHASGWNLLIKNGSTSREEVFRTCAYWLTTPYGGHKHEWTYRNIPRRVVFEKFLTDASGKVPKDYKFFMIHGICRMIQVDSDRFDGHTRTLYSPDWERLDVTLKFPAGPDIVRPTNLEGMLEIAKSLSSDFDFVRVDLYSIGEKVYFGELTHYPGSGMEKFSPTEFDLKLGSYWHMKGS